MPETATVGRCVRRQRPDVRNWRRGFVARARDGRRGHPPRLGRARRARLVTAGDGARPGRRRRRRGVAHACGPTRPASPARRRRRRRLAAARRHLTTADGRCTVIVDPVSDGRERFAEAMRHLPAGVTVDEKAVTGVLYEPADVEPDLVLVLGPPTRLPPSLVWELAYSELVFAPIALAELRSGAPAAGGRGVPRPAAPLRRPRHVTRRRVTSHLYRDTARRAAHLQARRGRPHRRAADRRERQGARRRQGRAQDEVQVRRPARADEPRPAAAAPGPRARHRQPGRVGRAAAPRCWPASTGRRRGWPCWRPPTSWRWSASRTPSCTGCSSACCARSPSAPARSSCRRSTGSCWPPRACGPSSTCCVRCGEAEPDVALVAFDLAEGGVLCRSCRSGTAISPAALTLLRGDPRRGAQRRPVRARVAGHPRGRRARHPGHGAPPRAAARGRSPCSNATDPEHGSSRRVAGHRTESHDPAGRAGGACRAGVSTIPTASILRRSLRVTIFMPPLFAARRLRPRSSDDGAVRLVRLVLPDGDDRPRRPAAVGGSSATS